MRYGSYAYIEPPRPESKIMAGSLGVFEGRGWVAQVKKNGTNSVIFLPPKGKGDPFAKTRHPNDSEHKAWAFTEKSIALFRNLQNKEWHVFNAELMHSKGNGIRDTNYIHDVLVLDGEYLLGKTFDQRYQLLLNRLGFHISHPTETHRSHYVLNDNTWLAKNHSACFLELFSKLQNEDEGLVLKNPKGALSARDNSGWMVKCRRPHKNYSF